MDDKLSEGNDGRIVKMEIDYADQVTEAIPKAEALLKRNQLGQALDALYGLEKQTRLGADMRSNGRLLEAMVRLCYEAKDYPLLNETIVTLSKKRMLIKSAVTKMVQLACTYVNQMPSEEQRLKLIDTLRTVTAGKIYVENERAVLTKQLVEYKENKGEVDEACTLLLDLQIETFGSMEQKEKVSYLLEQMRLCLRRNDFVRASIISRKISVRFFEKTEAEVQELKLKFYRLMIQVDQHDNKYAEVCKHYWNIAKTPTVVEDTAKLDECMKCVVIYALLTAHDNEQWDLLHRIKLDEAVKRLPKYLALLEIFTTELLINWRQVIVAEYEKLLKEGVGADTATDVFKGTDGEKRWADLQTRVGEHNIRIIAKYYTEIRLERMALLLDWTVEKTEEFACQLVVSGVIAEAQIDRPAGVMRFRRSRGCVQQLDDWGQQLKRLNDTLNKASHLILKEQMVHRHLLKHHHHSHDQPGGSAAATAAH